MSANVDLVRSIFADWERGEFASAGWAHPQIRLEVVGGPSEANSSGVTEMAANFREFVAVMRAPYKRLRPGPKPLLREQPRRQSEHLLDAQRASAHARGAAGDRVWARR